VSSGFRHVRGNTVVGGCWVADGDPDPVAAASAAVAVAAAPGGAPSSPAARASGNSPATEASLYRYPMEFPLIWFLLLLLFICIIIFVAACSHVCNRLRRCHGVKSIFQIQYLYLTSH